MDDKKLINIVKGDIRSAIKNGEYERSTEYQANIEFDTKSKQILLDGVAYSNSLIEVTWNELKDLRDNAQLTPGSCYRITDYHCTTTQEDTYSADHQFDIVLLALSTNKLAEQGWAMMHENVYDVTFDDGVTKKCHAYIVDEYNHLNVVSIETLLGIEGLDESEYSINENDKNIIISGWESGELNNEDVPYNYFQNSKLEAWKVWYCLDNDTDRFAWADKGMIDINNYLYGRYSQSDSDGFYAWYNEEDGVVYTKSNHPKQGDAVYNEDKKLTPIVISSFVSNGRGVIYRLIDEFNNDVAYDFKNIQFTRKLLNGKFDDNGQDTWCYTFTTFINNNVTDASIKNEKVTVDNNFIGPVFASLHTGGDFGQQELPYNVIIGSVGEIVNTELTNSTYNSIFGRMLNVKLFGCNLCSLININEVSTTSVIAFTSENLQLQNGKMYIFSKEVATVP